MSIHPTLSSITAFGFFLALSACGSSGTNSGFNDPTGSSASNGNGSGSGNGSGNTGGGTNGGLGSGGGSSGGMTGSTNDPPAEVWGHSPDTLYKVDPTTKAVTVFGKFKGCSQVIDLALDKSSNMFVTTQDGFYSVDKSTGTCTHIADGNYPNSLSFVPAGTLDPNEEALVGYVGDTYVRIDTTSGSMSNVGSLSAGSGVVSSGDIVSVKNGPSYLTVTGGKSCGTNDCLIEVDPATGKMVKDHGSIDHGSVFGLAFWAGTVYGFDDGGDLFSVDIDAMTGALTTTAITVPNAPNGLQFWGAGSTTSAPPKGIN
jgi:hypothetical protein